MVCEQPEFTGHRIFPPVVPIQMVDGLHLRVRYSRCRSLDSGCGRVLGLEENR